MSGCFTSDARQESENLGGVELISKPFTPGELASVVKHILHPEPASKVTEDLTKTFDFT
jgi:DNA-binding response OmpR family regulator